MEEGSGSEAPTRTATPVQMSETLADLHRPRANYLRTSRIWNKAILQWMLLLLFLNPVLCDSAGGGNQGEVPQREETATVEPPPSSSNRDVFYRRINEEAVKDIHEHNSEVCSKEHRIKERDVQQEDLLNLKVKKREDENEQEMEKESFLGVGGTGDDDDDYGFGPPRDGRENVSYCNSCSRDKMRMQSLETIKDSILSKLGMSHPPNVTEKPKPKIADHLLTMLLKKRHPHHGNSGLKWVVDEDELQEMQGDEPYDLRISDDIIGNITDFTNKSSIIRSHANVSDTKYIEMNDFQEGEVQMEEEDDYHVRTERIVTFSQPHPRLRHLPRVQYFEFSDQLRSSRVKRAVLWMYIRGRQTAPVVGNRISISVYKIIDAGKPGIGGSREAPVITSVKADTTRSVPTGSGAWITMEYIQIRNLVAEWFKNPQRNLGIVINAEDDNGTNLVVTSENGEDTEFIPFLEVFVTDNRKHRTKRTVGLNCRDSSKETRCCRYPLTVDFVEFGWDWIIAPKKYDAFYCAGECPLAFLPQHPHTHVFHLANAPGGSPCCAPRKLSELEMLYFDQNMNIIFGRIPAMKVDRCGCV